MPDAMVFDRDQRHGHRGMFELVGQDPLSFGERIGEAIDPIGELHRPLMDFELFVQPLHGDGTEQSLCQNGLWQNAALSWTIF